MGENGNSDWLGRYFKEKRLSVVAFPPSPIPVKLVLCPYFSVEGIQRRRGVEFNFYTTSYPSWTPTTICSNVSTMFYAGESRLTYNFTNTLRDWVCFAIANVLMSTPRNLVAVVNRILGIGEIVKPIWKIRNLPCTGSSISITLSFSYETNLLPVTGW